MFKKGRKRENKGLAVLYFIIGLIILLIILGVIYFALVQLDYSDQLKNPDATQRAYVQTTDAIGATVMPLDLDVDGTPVPDEVDLTAPTDTPTPEPSPTPTEEPTPTPEPTPEPTAVPRDMYATPLAQVPNLPEFGSANGAIGITACSVSAADDNKVMTLEGYGYVNEETFDGTKARTWLVVTRESTQQKLAYEVKLVDGISNLPHSNAVCLNPSASDFSVTLDVSQYDGDIYSMALVIAYYKPDAKNAKDITMAYYLFSGNMKFTIMDGRVVDPVTPVDYE